MDREAELAWEDVKINSGLRAQALETASSWILALPLTNYVIDHSNREQKDGYEVCDIPVLLQPHLYFL